MIGKTLSHYQITEELGRGGMGVVYKAKDTKLKRTVALKFLSPHLLTDPKEKARFIHEAQAAAALDHPNISTIHEVHEADGHTFMVMAFIEGQDVGAKMDAGPMNLGETLDIAIQVARGLSKAHTSGIVHRDIKPGNVIVTNDGIARIVDFGLAKLATQTKLTKTGTTMGTVRYMSPEQATGEEVDHRTDVWSLGVMLYEMLAGRPPFRGDVEPAMVYSILNENPKPITEVRKEIPIALEDIIEKALAKEPSKRFATMEEFLAALERQRDQITLGITERKFTAIRKLKRRKKLSATIAAVLVVAIAAVLTQTFYTKSRAINSVAVLPLENLTGDPDKEYFADGMTNELITRLGRVGAVNVISRQSVKRFKGSDLPLDEVAKELHVDAVVEGSLRLDGDRLFITARLIDARSDRQIWANTLEGNIADVMSLQSQVAQAVSEKLRVALTPEERSALRHSRPVDPAAYDTCLKAYHYGGLYREADLKRSIKLYREAINIDPTYAPAYAGLATVYLRYTFNAYGPPGDMIPLARAAAEEALKLDESLAEAHSALARIRFVHDWDWSAPEAGFKRAIELNPNSRDAHRSLGSYYILTGRADKGIAEMKRSVEIDPLSVGTNINVGWGYFTSSRFDEAIAALEKTISMDPAYSFAWEELAWSHAANGMAKEAIAAADTAVSLTPKPLDDTITLSGLGWVYGISGESEKALAMHNRLLELREEKYVDDWYLAQTYAALGEIDSAFACMDRAIQERSPSIVFMKVTPELSILRSDPRYEALMRRVGIPLD